MTLFVLRKNASLIRKEYHFEYIDRRNPGDWAESNLSCFCPTSTAF